MGNLGRPGYPGTTDGTWPYTLVYIFVSGCFWLSDSPSYDSCDVGTFPNQTRKDRMGPAAAIHSDTSKEKYNYELSWLPGQRLRSLILIVLGSVLTPAIAHAHVRTQIIQALSYGMGLIEDVGHPKSTYSRPPRIKPTCMEDLSVKVPNSLPSPRIIFI